MAVRRSAALAIGGWAEEMATGEDVDFSHRLTTSFRTSIAYAPGALLYHRTRSTRDALIRQARSYGAGAADLYLRYPRELHWDSAKTISLCTQLASRLFARLSTRIQRPLGYAGGMQIEFADYHWLWTSNFWSGFFARYGRKGIGPG
jgi:hypothetical protein